MPATSGDVVRVHYRGTLGDGTEFDSSEGRGPLEFRLGEGEVIEGFDPAVTGLGVGEVRTVTHPPGKANAPKNERPHHPVRAPRPPLLRTPALSHGLVSPSVVAMPPPLCPPHSSQPLLGCIRPLPFCQDPARAAFGAPRLSPCYAAMILFRLAIDGHCVLRHFIGNAEYTFDGARAEPFVWSFVLSVGVSPLLS